MATITVTIGDVFLAAIQAEAALAGLGAQAWAKGVLKAEVTALRLAREEQTTETTRVNSVTTASAAALATKEAQMAALKAQLDALT